MDTETLVSLTTYSSLALVGLGTMSLFGTIGNMTELETRIDQFYEQWNNIIKTTPEYTKLPPSQSIEEYLLAASSIYKNSPNNRKGFLCLEDTLATLDIYRSLARLNDREDIVLKARYEDAYGLSSQKWAGHAYITYEKGTDKKRFETTINTPLIPASKLNEYWNNNSEKYNKINIKPIFVTIQETAEKEYKNNIIAGGLGRTMHFISRNIGLQQA